MRSGHSRVLHRAARTRFPPPGGLRADAAEWPGGGVEAYCACLFDEILPCEPELAAVCSSMACRPAGRSRAGAPSCLATLQGCSASTGQPPTPDTSLLEAAALVASARCTPACTGPAALGRRSWRAPRCGWPTAGSSGGLAAWLQVESGLLSVAACSCALVLRATPTLLPLAAPRHAAPPREDLPAHAGPWPQRLFLGVGTAEYARPELDALLVDSCRQLAALLERRGLGADRLRLQVREGLWRPPAAAAAVQAALLPSPECHSGQPPAGPRSRAGGGGRGTQRGCLGGAPAGRPGLPAGGLAGGGLGQGGG